MSFIGGSNPVAGVSSAISATTGTVSIDNSSTTPLASSATFTGEWVDVTGYQSLVVAVKADQNSTFTVDGPAVFWLEGETSRNDTEVDARFSLVEYRKPGTE